MRYFWNTNDVLRTKYAVKQNCTESYMRCSWNTNYVLKICVQTKNDVRVEVCEGIGKRKSTESKIHEFAILGGKASEDSVRQSATHIRKVSDHWPRRRSRRELLPLQQLGGDGNQQNHQQRRTHGDANSWAANPSAGQQPVLHDVHAAKAHH